MRRRARLPDAPGHAGQVGFRAAPIAGQGLAALHRRAAATGAGVPSPLALRLAARLSTGLLAGLDIDAREPVGCVRTGRFCAFAWAHFAQPAHGIGFVRAMLAGRELAD